MKPCSISSTMVSPTWACRPSVKAYGGELARGEIDAIVTFMRYTWDDRAELPAEAAQAAAIPALAPDEVPSYEVHIAPIVKRYCISCHRPGKEEQQLPDGDYERGDDQRR